MSCWDTYGLKPFDDVKDKRVVLLQSGGLDSLVLSALFHRFGYEVHALFVDYGQCTAKRDYLNAVRISKEYGQEFHRSDIILPWLSLKDGDSMEYVPVRNSMLISLAWCLCEKLGFPYVSTALIGQEDIVTRKPLLAYDTHDTFARKLDEALNEGSKCFHEGRRITLLVPMIGYYKETVINLGEMLGVNFGLSNSCLANEDVPCGKCEPCKARKIAFKHTGLKDPLIP